MRRSKLTPVNITSPQNESAGSDKKKFSSMLSAAMGESDRDCSDTSSQIRLKFRSNTIENPASSRRSFDREVIETLVASVSRKLKRQLVGKISRLIKEKLPASEVISYVKERPRDESPGESNWNSPKNPLRSPVNNTSRIPSRRLTGNFNLQTRGGDASHDTTEAQQGNTSSLQQRVFDRAGTLHKDSGNTDEEDEYQMREERKRRPFVSPNKGNLYPSDQNSDASLSPDNLISDKRAPNEKILRKATTLLLRANSSSGSEDRHDRVKNTYENFKEEDGKLLHPSESMMDIPPRPSKKYHGDTLGVSLDVGDETDRDQDNRAVRHRRMPSAGSNILMTNRSRQPKDNYSIVIGDNMTSRVFDDSQILDEDKKDQEQKDRTFKLLKVLMSLRRKRVRASFYAVWRSTFDLDEGTNDKLKTIIKSRRPLLITRRSTKENAERLELPKEITLTRRTSYNANNPEDNKNFESREYIKIAQTLIRTLNGYTLKLDYALHTLMKHKDSLTEKEYRQRMLARMLAAVFARNNSRNRRLALDEFYSHSMRKSAQTREMEKRMTTAKLFILKLSSITSRATLRARMSCFFQMGLRTKAHYNPSLVYMRIAALALWKQKKTSLMRQLSGMSILKDAKKELFELTEKNIIIGTFRRLAQGWCAIQGQNLQDELEGEMQRRLRYSQLKAGIEKGVLNQSILRNRLKNGLERLRLNQISNNHSDTREQLTQLKKNKALGMLFSRQMEKKLVAFSLLLKSFSSSVIERLGKKVNLYQVKMTLSALTTAQSHKIAHSLFVLIKNSLGEERRRYYRSVLFRLGSLPRNQYASAFSQLKLQSDGYFLILSGRSLSLHYGMSILPGLFKPQFGFAFRKIAEAGLETGTSKLNLVRKLEWVLNMKAAEALTKFKRNALQRTNLENTLKETRQKTLKTVLQNAQNRKMRSALAILRWIVSETRIADMSLENNRVRIGKGLLVLQRLYTGLTMKTFLGLIITKERYHLRHMQRELIESKKHRALSKLMRSLSGLLHQAIYKLTGRTVTIHNSCRWTTMRKRKLLDSLNIAQVMKVQYAFSSLMYLSSVTTVKKQAVRWMESEISNLFRQATHTGFAEIQNKYRLNVKTEEKLRTVVNLYHKNAVSSALAKLIKCTVIHSSTEQMGKYLNKFLKRVVFNRIDSAGQRRVREREQREFRRTMGIVILSDKFKKLQNNRQLEGFWRTCASGLSSSLVLSTLKSDNYKRIIKAQVIFRINANLVAEKRSALKVLRSHSKNSLHACQLKGLSAFSINTNKNLFSAFVCLKEASKIKKYETISVGTERVNVYSIQTSTETPAQLSCGFQTQPIYRDCQSEAKPALADFGSTNVAVLVNSSTETKNLVQTLDQESQATTVLSSIAVETVNPELVPIQTQTEKIDAFPEADLTMTKREAQSISLEYNYKPETREQAVDCTVESYDKYTSIVIEEKVVEMESLTLVAKDINRHQRTLEILSPLVVNDQAHIDRRHLFEIDTSIQNKPLILLPHLKRLNFPESIEGPREVEEEEFEVRSHEERRIGSSFSLLGSFRTSENKKVLRGYRNIKDRDDYGFKIGNSKPRAPNTERQLERTNSKGLFETSDFKDEIAQPKAVQRTIPHRTLISDSTGTVATVPKRDATVERTRNDSMIEAGGDRDNSTFGYSYASRQDKRNAALTSPKAEPSITLYERLNQRQGYVVERSYPLLSVLRKVMKPKYELVAFKCIKECYQTSRLASITFQFFAVGQQIRENIEELKATAEYFESDNQKSEERNKLLLESSMLLVNPEAHKEYSC